MSAYVLSRTTLPSRQVSRAQRADATRRRGRGRAARLDGHDVAGRVGLLDVDRAPGRGGEDLQLELAQLLVAELDTAEGAVGRVELGDHALDVGVSLDPLIGSR